ncbi:hypothetical protein ACFWBN_02720 [Streptomyces sp. NPDC059989]
MPSETDRCSNNPAASPPDSTGLSRYSFATFESTENNSIFISL